jgi:hypothetical protein
VALQAYADSTWLRGLQVYQANGHALACSALRAAYPVLVQLLGDESFDSLAKAFWHAAPPTQGDAAQWGGVLAKFLNSSDQLVDEPYLADVAAVEWALHRASSAADGVVDAESFALLSAHDPADLHLVLSPGCATLNSGWPAVSIVNAHLHKEPSLEQAGRFLRAGVSEDALVWRLGLRPQVRVAQLGEAPFVAALLSGASLGEALNQAPKLDVSGWLTMAVQTSLLLGVRLEATSISIPFTING